MTGYYNRLQEQQHTAVFLERVPSTKNLSDFLHPPLLLDRW